MLSCVLYVVVVLHAARIYFSFLQNKALSVPYSIGKYSGYPDLRAPRDKPKQGYKLF